jgi:ATP-dependent DNA helicase PIF1
METFSKEQDEIFNKYISGKNIFITGPGGCGKTFLIKYIIKDAKIKLKNIHICALTGCASILLQCNARTLHSWAGIGLANEEIDIIVNRVIRSKIKRQNWENVEILKY